MGAFVLSSAVQRCAEQLIDWGGAQRWLKSDAEASFIRTVVTEVGGHATCLYVFPVPKKMPGRVQKAFRGGR